jgi:hypothetical protein
VRCAYAGVCGVCDAWIRREFNRKFREKGEAKDVEERDAINARRDKARTELRSWMAEKEAQLEVRRQQNRTDEEARLAEMDAAMDQESWLRVASLIDTSAPASDSEAGKVDPARFRHLLIQLKSEPLAKEPEAAASH